MLILGFQLPAISGKTQELLADFRDLYATAGLAAMAYIPLLPLILYKFRNQTVEELSDQRELVRPLLDKDIHDRVLAGYTSLYFFIKEVGVI